MKKKWILVITAVLLLLGVFAVEYLNPLRTRASFRKLDDYPLYEMHFYGSYGLSDYLEQGVEGDIAALPPAPEPEPEYACTCFAALSAGGERVFGRNFDWYEHPMMILFTDPPDGYASVSMVDLSYLGFERGVEPDRALKEMLRYTPYLTFDGMNEHGLAVGMMAISHAEAALNPEYVTIDSLAVIRLLLDRARNVEEALDLLGQYNVDFGSGPPIHYLIADAAGHSVVVEYLDNELVILSNEDPWQVSTNFLFHETEPELWRPTCWRYMRAYDALEEAAGQVSDDEAMAILNDVSQSNTIWSAVYNQTSGDIQLAMGRSYRKVYEFSLKE